MQMALMPCYLSMLLYKYNNRKNSPKMENLKLKCVELKAKKKQKKKK